MRVEPFGVNSYVHVISRGARGLPLCDHIDELRRFRNVLFYMNDEYFNEDWHITAARDPFSRPRHWPKRMPLVHVVAYTLMTNHFHLILKEIREGGVSAYMRKVGQSMTNYHNEKHGGSGSLFQGSYRGRTIGTDRYARYALTYVMVKNTFELFPRGGLRAASKNFERAWRWASGYPYSSFAAFAKGVDDPVVDAIEKSVFFSKPKEFKSFSRDVILGGKWTEIAFE